MARTALACTVVSLACSSAAPPEGANERVYSSEALQEAGVHPQGWRFIPLRPGQQASQALFERTTEACLRNETPDAVRFCMTQRGFYPTACNDGEDNDGDGWVDHPDDPGCRSPNAIREDPACDDGLDNDGDGLVDWDGGGVAHEDPDCENGFQRREQPEPGLFGR